MINNQQLTPTQLSVLEVFRRLYLTRLTNPSIETISQLAILKSPTVMATCQSLRDLGYLTNGGRSKRSYELSDVEKQRIDALSPATDLAPAESEIANVEPITAPPNS